jgi:hypothetical protein
MKQNKFQKVSEKRDWNKIGLFYCYKRKNQLGKSLKFAIITKNIKKRNFYKLWEEF